MTPEQAERIIELLEQIASNSEATIGSIQALDDRLERVEDCIDIGGRLYQLVDGIEEKLADAVHELRLVNINVG